jgi:hypothetical protein
MTLYLLKVHLQTFLSIPTTQKFQILSCDSLVANEGYVCWEISTYFILSLCEGISGFSGLEVACWPLVPKFAGSNPAKAIGFLRAKKSSAHLPSEGKLSRLSHVIDLRHVKDP